MAIGMIFPSGATPSSYMVRSTSQDDHPLPETITIGLLIPDSLQNIAAKSARLAIDEANGKGGVHDRTFQLVVRSTEGPWGAGSKESVSLVFEERVSAILGALDGRNGHLAEQVATKSHLTYLETVATESTLSQAFVPYFKRCVPNDDQQARSILKLIEQQGGGNLAILSNSQYDTRNAASRFQRIASTEHRNTPLILSIQVPGITVDQVVDQLTDRDIKHLVIPFRTSFTQELLKSLSVTLPEMKLYGTLAFVADLSPDDMAWNDLEGMFVFSTGLLHTPEGRDFQKRFRDSFGHPPTIASAYTYDGATMLIEAIRRAGPEREDIRETLGSMLEHKGVTGSISFDEMGNRKGPFGLMRVRDGFPVPLKE